MDSDEREIFNYLKTWGAEFVGAAEICRRATTKKRYYDNPDWAKPVLISMKDRGILEVDNRGSYRIKPIKKKKRDGQWMAPDIEKILKDGGMEVENNTGELAPDEYYDEL